MALLTSIAAEFREFIGSIIPQIVGLLKVNHFYIRRAGVEALRKLSEQGL
jgi:hypothetical protein